MVEGVRSIFRILQLLEDSLLAARIAKAEFIRVFNVEVGESTPAQTTETINSVKNLFDSKATFDVNSGRYVSTKAYRPIGDPIFNPTRNGKGSVTHENIGGDFQVRDIVDIDYFKNKLFSGLKIPKALLGFEESLPGGLGDNTLTRLDIRYSRSVKRVQNSLIVGIRDLCNIWLRLNNYGEEDKFQVILQAPSTAEELGRLTELDMKMSTINNSVRSLSEAFGEYLNVPKVFKVFFDQYINYPELKDKLDPELQDAIKKYEQHLKDAEEQRKAEAEALKRATENEEDTSDEETDGVGDYQGTSNNRRFDKPDLTPKKLTPTTKEPSEGGAGLE
jgi:predicted transcriptional regulator